MNSNALELFDLDHVMMNDGRIYRVLGNLNTRNCFLGYNVYSPSVEGDRFYQGRAYKKNYIEDENEPSDVLDTYELLPKDKITRHYDPIRLAQTDSHSFCPSIWFDLYQELVAIFGADSVGIFGSSMFGLHRTPEGTVRKDIDFVLQGLTNVALLRRWLPEIRNKLGFTAISIERQRQQYQRYQRVFRNENNSIEPIVKRRWTGLQLSTSVVSTLRFRDKGITIPFDLVARAPIDCENVTASGRVADADASNLFPRRFALITNQGNLTVYIFWWKFSTPVQDGDSVALCGSLIHVGGEVVIRLTNFTQHWLRIFD